MAVFIKTFLLVVFALIAGSVAAEEDREKKQVAGLGLPGFGYYDGYGRVLPYAGGLGYVGHPAYPGLGYRAFPGVGYPGYLGHPGYLAGHPYYGHPYAAYPYVR
ncbi:uncharacterized protein [Rhodnius prolixus]|uniref:uncharacterized protein n=1 Tax=Rhodnius prolixus TaxID=13249 RepID=UPI003D18E0DA